MTTQETTEKANSGNREQFAVNVITVSSLIVAVVFNLVLLSPEIRGGIFFFNDTVLHMLLIDMTVETITKGQNVTDSWQGTMNMGMPVFHYYQHLPHVAVALVHVFTFESITVATLVKWAYYLLLSAFPLSIYWSLRRFGFSKLTAAMGGIVSPLIASLDAADLVDLYGGLDYDSYTTRGWGLFTQLWAMVLLPPALACGYRVLRDGQGYFWATLLLASTFMSHLMFGYIAFITLGALTFIQLCRPNHPKFIVAVILVQWRRLIILVFLVAGVTSYFLIPFFFDGQYFNIRFFINPIYRDSLGYSAVLEALFKGSLFDFERLPSITILVLTGFILCLLRWRDERYLIPAVIFLLWLLLYFGRSTWGPLMDAIPMSRYIQMHRFIAGVHLGGIFLAAIALAAAWRWAISRTRLWYVVPVLTLTLLLLLPAYFERRSYLSDNAFIVDETQEALHAEDGNLSSLFEKLDQLPPGRTYAGQWGAGNWGEQYRVGFAHMFALLYTDGVDMMGGEYHRYALSSEVAQNFDETAWEQYNLFNVRYVVAPEKQKFPAFVRPLQQFGRHNLYEVQTSGYFDLVGADLVFEGDRADFYPAASTWIASGLPVAKQHPVIMLDGSSFDGPRLPLSNASSLISSSQSSVGTSRGEILSEDVGRNFFVAEVDVARESMLLLKTNYHPNWRVTVDGVRADKVMLMPGFLGVQLNQGVHMVSFEYHPGHLRAVLLGLGALTLALIPIGERWAPSVFSWIAHTIYFGRRRSLKWPKRTESRQARRRRRRR